MNANCASESRPNATVSGPSREGRRPALSRLVGRADSSSKRVPTRGVSLRSLAWWLIDATEANVRQQCPSAPGRHAAPLAALQLGVLILLGTIGELGPRIRLTRGPSGGLAVDLRNRRSQVRILTSAQESPGRRLVLVWKRSGQPRG